MDEKQRNGQSIKVQRRKVVSSSNSSSSASQNLISQAAKMKNTRIKEIRKRRRDLFTRINYTHTITTVVLPLLMLCYMLYFKESILPENQATLKFTSIYYNVTMLAFTAGYHKYFAHNSYKIKYSFLKYYFAIFGTSCGLGSIRWWSSLHHPPHLLSHYHYQIHLEDQMLLFVLYQVLYPGKVWLHQCFVETLVQ